MNLQEEITRIISEHPQLTFVDLFLRDHPTANLFLVGGALRDIILAKQRPPSGSLPSHTLPSGRGGITRKGGEFVTDFDFVIQHLAPEKIESWFSMHGKIELVGKNFGVFKFIPDPHLAPSPPIPSPRAGEGYRVRGENRVIDLALPRTEHALSNSVGGYREFDVQSNPDLPIEDDLARRDFTVNAMAYDLRTRALIDPHHGEDDLTKKLIRAVGDPTERFREDLTRLLRAIRFAAQLQFSIEQNTSAAIKTIVPEINRLKQTKGKNEYVIAREMIGEEIAKSIFADPKTTIQLLVETGLLEELFPSVMRCLHVDSHYLDPLLSLSPSFTRRGLGGGRANEIELAIILLLRGLTKPEAQTAIFFTGLQTLPKQAPYRIDSDRVLWVIDKLHTIPTPEDIIAMRASQFEKHYMSTHGKLHVETLKQIAPYAVIESIHTRRNEICAKWKCDEHEPIPPLVRGDDLLRLGIPAGVRVRELLEEIRDHQLDGILLTREAALHWIKQKLF